MDAALRHNFQQTEYICLRVSILVLMDAALRRKTIPQTPKNEHVSILVLMDAALRRQQRLHGSQKAGGFNPCFDGCRPATGTNTNNNPVGIIVSILVLMDAALRRT